MAPAIELKTMANVVDRSSNGLSGALSSTIMNGRGQAGNIIVDARGQLGMTPEIAQRGINRAFGADNLTGSKIQSLHPMEQFMCRGCRNERLAF